MIAKTSLRVLIVEDQDMISKAIKRQLEEIGHNVVGVALNGKQAVHMTEVHRPDVILMDIGMPEMDGLEATRLIHEKYPTPIVLLTGFDDPELIKQASVAGACAYLLKPTSAKEMERTMIFAVARFGDLMELRRVNSELKEAMDKVKMLNGLLPICAKCKKIRNDTGYWEAVEDYIMEHSDAHLSHSVCPECLAVLYPEFKPKTS